MSVLELNSVVPEKYILRFGNEIATELHFLEQDLYQLRLDWRLYRGLFGTNPERVELLNSVSGYFSETIERLVFESVLVKLRRFVDKGSNRRSKRPLSIELLRKISKSEGSRDLNLLINECDKACAFAKNWTDKRIAHSDYEYRLGKITLDKASRRQVTAAIDSIAAVIKWIGAETLDTHFNTHPIADLRDETFVLKLLYEGKQVWESKPAKAQELIESGQYDEYKKVYDYPEWLQSLQDEFD